MLMDSSSGELEGPIHHQLILHVSMLMNQKVLEDEKVYTSLPVSTYGCKVGEAELPSHPYRHKLGSIWYGSVWVARDTT